MDFLEDIIAKKKLRLAEARRSRTMEDLRGEAYAVRRDAETHALRRALENGSRINVIAEFKRASPSKGIIRAGVEPGTIAKSYEAGGAAAISVLTEEDRFQGSLDDLRAVRRAVRLPVLRKDFIFDEYQLYEAAAAGADALLLIVAALSEDALSRLRKITEDDLGMDALVEVHSKEEMRQAQAAGARLIGVNNRDLRTFEVSLDVSAQLACHAPDDAFLVSESGIKTGDDLKRLRAMGYNGFLIGETLMRAEQPETTLRALINEGMEKAKAGK